MTTSLTPTTTSDKPSKLEIPELPDSAILMVEVGSTAHGTGIDGGEDHDQLAVIVESPHQLMGLSDKGFTTVMQRTQPEGSPSGPGDIDRTLFSLRQFLRLASTGNPSVLMALWAPIEFISPEGEELRALSEAFVGRHVIPRYRGYMQSQVKKVIATIEANDDDIYPTKPAMHAARLGFQGIELVTTGNLTLPMEGRDADWLRNVRYGRVGYDEWFERTVELDAALDALLSDESVPPLADRARIEDWSVTTHQSLWNDIY